MMIASKCGLLTVENYSHYYRRKNVFGVCVSVKGMIESECFNGLRFDLSKYENADELLMDKFGVTVNEAISVIVSKHVHGKDRSGRYVVTKWDTDLKRPRRKRFYGNVAAHIDRYLSDPQSVYTNDHVKSEHLCPVCGFRAESKFWPTERNFLFDIEYISHCPKCAERKEQDDMRDLIVAATGVNIDSKIVQVWSHDRPHRFFSGNVDAMTCENGYKGSVILVKKEYER